jgi:hypothetical protein
MGASRTGRNGIETKGNTILADCLVTNSPLIELHLDGNRLNDDDAILIASALETNTN